MHISLSALPTAPRDARTIAYTTQAIARVTRQIRWLLLIMILGLGLSGLTAIPLVGEIALLRTLIGPGTWMHQQWPAMAVWIDTVHQAIRVVTQDYPLLRYGTDWLAFAHIVIAIAFIGPLRDPVRNIWVVEFGLIACVLVVPMALVFGPLRGIPLFWRMIDCSFGLFGFIPLWIARRQILVLGKLKQHSQSLLQ